MRFWPCLLVVCLGAAMSGAPAPALAADGALTSGIDRSAFDMATKPSDNFFLYVNGTWIKHNPIPPEYSRWGAFPKLRDDNLLALREILEDLTQQNGTLDADRRKLRDLYAMAMDEAKLEKDGAAPLADELCASPPSPTPTTWSPRSPG